MSLSQTTRVSASPKETDRKPRTKSSFEGPGATTEEAVKVICRVRPFNPKEIDLNERGNEGKAEWDQTPLRSVVEFDGPRCTFLDHDKQWMEKEVFQFDSCLWSIPDEMESMPNNPYAGQDALFNDHGVVMMQQAWKGYNTCVFAYGQTGSGKTYSMMGEDPINNPEEAGLIPRVCKRLFDMVLERRAEAEKHKEKYVMTFKVEVKYMEIYEEKIKDLLWPLCTLPPEVKAKINDENMKLRSSPATGVFVENLTSVEVDSWERMLELIEMGNTSRHVAATKMNERSSRSHAIFKILLNQVTTSIPKKQFEKPVEHVRESLINLVDLAGSERNKKTGATGERLREAASINRSLLALKQVIEALADNSTATKVSPRKVPYRDSHLTELLMDSLGGNSKTFMLICVSPHMFNADETLQTLRYGSRARQIVNVVKVNENSAGRMLLDLEDELAKMKVELEKQSNPEEIDALKAQIAERESSLQVLETEMEQQHQRLIRLRDEQQREQSQREAAALLKLLAIGQATDRRKNANMEEQRLRRRLSDVQHSKLTLEKRYEAAVRDVDRLQDLIEDHKQRSAEFEQEIVHVKKRNSRLDIFIKELTKTIEDQQLELERLKNEKIATILRARHQAAKIRLEEKRRAKTLTQLNDDECKKLKQASADKKQVSDYDFDQRKSVIEADTKTLRQQISALTAEYNKLESEKTSQISNLEKEEQSLKDDHKREADANAARIRQTDADWERKYEALISEMQDKHEQLDVQWSEKYNNTVEAEEANYEKSTDEWQRELEDVKQLWEDKKNVAIEEGTRKCNDAEAVWKKKFEAKMAENKELREALDQVAGSEEKAADMAFRISSVLSQLSQTADSPKTADCQRIETLLTAFVAEFEANQLGKTRLVQLHRGDFTRTRCREIPQIAEAELEKQKKIEEGAEGERRPTRAISPHRAFRSIGLKSAHS